MDGAQENSHTAHWTSSTVGPEYQGVLALLWLKLSPAKPEMGMKGIYKRRQKATINPTWAATDKGTTATDASQRACCIYSWFIDPTRSVCLKPFSLKNVNNDNLMA